MSWADWECPCDQCMGRLEPPEPTAEEEAAWLAEQEAARYDGPSDVGS